MSGTESLEARERPRGIAALTETLRGQLLSLAVLALVLIVLTAVAPGVWDRPWVWASVAAVAVATGLALLGQGPLYDARWMEVLVPAMDLLAIMLLLGDVGMPRIVAMLAVVPAFWLGFVGRRVGLVIVAAGGIAMGIAMALQISASTGTTTTANAVGAVLVPVALIAAAYFADSYTGRIDQQQLVLLEREREKTEMARQLAADGVLLDNIFDTARVGLMLLDADGGVVRINPTLTGHPALEGTDLEHVLDGASFLDLESRQPIPYGEMPFLRAARGESFDNSRFWIARPGHDMFAVTVSSRPLMVDGEFRGSIASVDDVTAYMRMLEDRDDFVALISHELRTPLTSIAGYIELAIDEEMSDELRSWLKIVERNSTRLRTLVEDLLIVGEMSRGELHLEPAETDLRSLAQDAVATLAHRARNRGVELRLVDGPPVPLVADARRVSQVVENLISNGIKYTSDDGFVEVRVGAEGADALLEVSDDGPGVAPDEAARVFERFYRSSAARASGVQGAGLGLWICRMIAQAHGGTIAFDSEVGAGSVASVRLPAGR
ncbi:sensor histidine kinase [Agrococcus jenensis]|uniref:histidine kinase n=1 Tax=Agrococcus jenensis TaxID=46353 RepID=A0A3N2APP2_9MICO|nr:HAMP domain-containing sensor histidine kinase [Agrococcus jenensis]ROR65027.1 phospho-acceptor domain-containing protein [Agrococcus jenensis]